MTSPKKSIFSYSKELFLAIAIALSLATLIKLSWFELYEIPTGSMRPTFEEKDRLIVTKTAFGINIPLVTDHFYFDPSLVKRGSIIIWSGDGMDISDLSTYYFWIFPSTKRFVKRCMGKPGDILYFYGGKIYGLDSEGNPLTELLEAPWLDKLEWVPFITFDGETKALSPHEITFSLMHETLGRLLIESDGTTQGEIFNGKQWLKDNPDAQKTPHNRIETYSDFWGIKNYAMARLLTPAEFATRKDLNKEGIGKSVLYLELSHTPSLSYPKPFFVKTGFGYTIDLNSYRTVVPLEERHIKALMEHMYTARFILQNSAAQRYSAEAPRRQINLSPIFPAVPDGTYEFYFGKAKQIGWGAIPSAVPAYSQLYSSDPLNVQKLFNYGVDFNTVFSPREHAPFPHRYAYFRNGALYLLGGEIFSANDSVLKKFLEREKQKQESSSRQEPYIAFQDYGSPIRPDGSWNKELIQTFGLKIPEKHYLMLGDNHAMSGDSRVFGFVPEANLQGTPTWLIWPPGDDRIGRPPQPPMPLFTTSRVIIWSIVALIVIAYLVWQRRHKKKQD
jgi:signal peptidase I